MLIVRLAVTTCMGNSCSPGCRLWCLWWRPFVLSFFPRDVLGEMWDLIESVSEGFILTLLSLLILRVGFDCFISWSLPIFESFNTEFSKSGSGCLKLTTLLVNVSLNFKNLISRICQYFYWKNVRSFCNADASLIFSTKYFSVFGYKVVKLWTSWPLSELVKLTMLWTTGPRSLPVHIEYMNYWEMTTFLKPRFWLLYQLELAVCSIKTTWHVCRYLDLDNSSYIM